MVRLLSHPLVPAPRPVASPQFDQRLFAPLGELKSKLPGERHVVVGQIVKGQDQLLAVGPTRHFVHQVALGSRRRQQSTGDVDELPIAEIRGAARAVAAPKDLPIPVGRQIRVVRRSIIKSE